MKHRLPMTLISVAILIVACALFRLFASVPHHTKSDQDTSTVTPALVRFWASRRKVEHPSTLPRHGKGALSDANAPNVEARVDECRSDWGEQLASMLHWRAQVPMGRGREPMVVKNGRDESITVSLVPPRAHRRSSWTISPGETWKSHTNIGQRWLFADHGRCLFYVTAGNEPLHLAVKSAS